MELYTLVCVLYSSLYRCVFLIFTFRLFSASTSRRAKWKKNKPYTHNQRAEGVKWRMEIDMFANCLTGNHIELANTIYFLVVAIS